MRTRCGLATRFAHACSGTLVAVGAILGVGIGAAVGSAIDDLSAGIWIGAVIGVGLGMLAGFFVK